MTLPNTLQGNRHIETAYGWTESFCCIAYGRYCIWSLLVDCVRGSDPSQSFATQSVLSGGKHLGSYVRCRRKLTLAPVALAGWARRPEHANRAGEPRPPAVIAFHQVSYPPPSRVGRPLASATQCSSRRGQEEPRLLRKPDILDETSAQGRPQLNLRPRNR
jgi:hypothetical protein